ncbi:chaplin [Streptomyces sp. ME18-1-4]|uniref:chaplin n=1 Tax=Streptomyces sp. ME18-1-4 TaxID=3028685 RepID=UPI0029B2C42B|nr:chaplin [Streptomyces sp. ME18-1-4]MDX3242814.1 chaplin [Streptomyces sp. ME18-1-4]
MSRIAKGLVLTSVATAAIAGASGIAVADSGAEAVAAHSPGVLSGNVIQLPLHDQTNTCGNSTGAGGLLNPAFGTTCVND